MRFQATETVTLVATPEVQISGVAVVYGTPQVPQSGDRASQSLQILDPAHTPLEPGTVLRVRGKLARVTGIQDHTNPFTGWRPPSVINAVLAVAALADTATISRQTGSTFDRATNVETPTWTQVWAGPCSVDVSLQGRTPNVADQVTNGVPVTVSVPLDVLDVRPGDVVRVTASHDGRLVGRALTVTAVMASTSDPVRRLSATDHLEA